MKRFLLGLALAAAGRPVFAQEPPLGLNEARAVLASPIETKTVIIDGRTWRCEGAVCAGRAAAAPLSQPVTHECQRVEKALGALVAYRSRETRDERVLTAGCRRPG